MIYNLLNTEEKMLDAALTLLAQTYDQHGFKKPDEIFRLRDKIRECSTVSLITHTKKRTFADEA